MKKYKFILAAVAALALTACNSQADYPVDTQYLPVKLKGSQKWSIIKLETGEVVARDAFDNAPSAVVDDMFYVADSLGRIDYYNIADVKKPINKEKYGSATYFNNDRAIVSRPGSALTIIDRQGNEVAQLPQSFDRATMFVNNRAIVHSDNGLFSYIKPDGDTIKNGGLGYAALFLYDNTAVVSRSASATDSVTDITAIDIEGNDLFSVSSNEYQLVSPFFTNGVLPVVKNDKRDTLFYLDRKGKEVENPNAAPKAVKDANYKDGARTMAGYFLALKGDRMGMVDKDNNVKIPFKYNAIIDISKTRYIARTDSLCVILDDNGKQVGKEQFTDFVTVNYNNGAIRGTIDTSMMAANILQMFNDSHACGAAKGATLMELNNLIGNDPTPFVGLKALPQMMGSLAVVYHFEDDIATLKQSDSVGTPTPQFNFDDRVTMVSISLDMHQCKDQQLQEVATLVERGLGMAGFVLKGDNIFVSENATAVTTGYSDGVLNLRYFMNDADASPLPRNLRP